MRALVLAILMTAPPLLAEIRLAPPLLGVDTPRNDLFMQVTEGLPEGEAPKAPSKTLPKLKSRVWIGASAAVLGGVLAFYNQECALEGPESDIADGVTYEYRAIEKDGKCYVGGTFGEKQKDGTFLGGGGELELKESYPNAAKGRDTTVRQGAGHFPTAVRILGGDGPGRARRHVAPLVRRPGGGRGHFRPDQFDVSTVPWVLILPPNGVLGNLLARSPRLGHAPGKQASPCGEHLLLYDNTTFIADNLTETL